MKGGLWKACKAAIVFVLVVAMILSPVVRVLALGWLDYLRRVLPAVTLDGPSIALGLTATVLFAGLLHGVVRSFVGTWSIRGTLVAVGLIFVAFAAGVALVGITHQVIWLATSDRPMFERRVGRSITREQKVSDLATALNNFKDTYRRYPVPDSNEMSGWSWESSILNYTTPGYWHRW